MTMTAGPASRSTRLPPDNGRADMTEQDDVARVCADAAALPTCSDHDEDCDEIEDKVHCYLYDPFKGMCPFLRTQLMKERSDV
jgi:hypothetical protein